MRGLVGRSNGWKLETPESLHDFSIHSRIRTKILSISVCYFASCVFPKHINTSRTSHKWCGGCNDGISNKYFSTTFSALKAHRASVLNVSVKHWRKRICCAEYPTSTTLLKRQRMIERREKERMGGKYDASAHWRHNLRPTHLYCLCILEIHYLAQTSTSCFIHSRDLGVWFLSIMIDCAMHLMVIILEKWLEIL